VGYKLQVIDDPADVFSAYSLIWKSSNQQLLTASVVASFALLIPYYLVLTCRIMIPALEE
jgi:hypothetical protein